MPQQSIDYCQKLVRHHDPDRYLASLFAPAKARADLWALYAFNYEIAKTREVVSDTTIGLIRLQWWRDVIKEIYEEQTPRRHEVVEPLAGIIKTHDLPRELFDNLIYAREFDLEGLAPANLEGLLNYCDFTNTPLTTLALKIIGEEANQEAIKAVSVHYALLGTLRAVPYMLKSRRMMLPQEILVKYNVSEQKIYDFNKVENLPQVISEVLMTKNQFRYDQTVHSVRFLKAMKAIADLYEHQIESAQFDVLSTNAIRRPPFFEFRVWVKTLF